MDPDYKTSDQSLSINDDSQLLQDQTSSQIISLPKDLTYSNTNQLAYLEIPTEAGFIYNKSFSQVFISHKCTSNITLNLEIMKAIVQMTLKIRICVLKDYPIIFLVIVSIFKSSKSLLLGNRRFFPSQKRKHLKIAEMANYRGSHTHSIANLFRNPKRAKSRGVPSVACC